MLYVMSWWFIDIRQGPFKFLVMYEYEPYLSGACKIHVLPKE